MKVLKNSLSHFVCSGFRDVWFKTYQHNYDHLIGYDFGVFNEDANKAAVSEYGLRNMWQAWGNGNCYTPHSETKTLQRIVKVRNEQSGFIQKIYYYTVDIEANWKLGFDKGAHFKTS